MSRLVDSPAGDAVAFGWGLAEALSRPVIAEMELALVGTAVPRRTPRQAVALAAGSVSGVVLHVWLRRRSVTPPLPWTTTRMHEQARADLAERGARAFWRQQFNVVPVKVYAAEAARSDLPLAAVAAGAAAARGSRIVGLGLAATAGAHLLHRPARRRWGLWMLAATAGWALGQRAALRRWR